MQNIARRQVMVYLFIIIHWNGCIYFGISDTIGLGSDSWVAKANLTLSQQYIWSFYW